MAGILQKIRRIREIDEERARLELRDNQLRYDDLNRELTDIGERVQASHSSTKGTNAADLALHHAFALRMEMERRQQKAKCEEQSVRVEEHRETVVQASRQTRVAELVEEREAAAVRHIAATKEQRELDEMGIRGWYMNSLVKAR
jgi:flagellar export protein FliJ